MTSERKKKGVKSRKIWHNVNTCPTFEKLLNGYGPSPVQNHLIFTQKIGIFNLQKIINNNQLMGDWLGPWNNFSLPLDSFYITIIW